MPLDFPIAEFMDEQACYQWLVQLLHPNGLNCPRCQACEGLIVHRRRREPVTDYRCSNCHRVFNVFTGTVWEGTPRRPSQIVLILRGVAQGQTTAQMARELHCSRSHLLERRHQLQENAVLTLERNVLPDGVVEADEMYQNAGEKR